MIDLCNLAAEIEAIIADTAPVSGTPGANGQRLVIREIQSGAIAYRDEGMSETGLRALCEIWNGEANRTLYTVRPF